MPLRQVPVAGIGLGCGSQQHPYLMPGGLEMPRDHEAVAAVVAPAAGDGDRARDALRLKQPGGIRSGVLHQHDTRDAVLLDGEAIEFANSLSCQPCHAHQPPVADSSKLPRRPY
jgi:hypothetical protein